MEKRRAIFYGCRKTEHSMRPFTPWESRPGTDLKTSQTPGNWGSIIPEGKILDIGEDSGFLGSFDVAVFMYNPDEILTPHLG